LKTWRYLSDPSLYILLAVNGWLIWQYRQDPDTIHTIIPLYWMQSVLIGIFNFFDMLTLQQVNKSGLHFNNQQPDGKGFTATFFLLHYGFFHLVYLMFMPFFGISVQKIDWPLMKFTFVLLLASQVITFVQHKLRYRRVKGNLGQVMVLPYLRIVPMHLAILTPAFFPISNYMVFLVLKTIFDVIMQIVYHRLMYKDSIVNPS
jgi:hypothetical protein